MRYIFFALIIFTKLNAQIDTTDWYPLHVGDKWEYYGREVGYSQVEIIGDTLMPNGKKYFVFPALDVREYQRLENKRYVMVYNDSYEDEYVRFDLHGKKGDNWTIFDKEIRFGIYKTGSDYNNFLGLKLEWNEYREVYIDTTKVPADTLWEQTVDTYWPRITKGLGVTSYAYDLEELVGAVINGIGYGSLVDIRNDQIKDAIYVHQNYPNPFNPNTYLRYSISEESKVIISVYNILGEKIKVLFQGKQKKGEYTTEFNASHLNSGIYFIEFVSNNFRKVIKAQLLK